MGGGEEWADRGGDDEGRARGTVDSSAPRQLSPLGLCAACRAVVVVVA